MPNANLLIIAGIPGTGKTTFGNFLETKGYLHLDMEEGHRTSKILDDPEGFIKTNLPSDKNAVLTWGFSPDQETIDLVNQLRDFGFRVFWFDGDRKLARQASLNRPDFSEEVLRQQMEALNAWNVPPKISAAVVNVFDATGFRRSLAIAEEVGAI